MLIAHDLGTTGDKASLHDDDGRLRAAVTVSYPARFADGGVAEQDPRDWHRAVVEATRALLAQTGTAPADVRGIVISGQMMGAVLLDASFEPVRDAIIWADTRAQRQADQLVERLGEREAYELLGHRLNATYSIAKVMWVRDHEPEVFARTRWFCVAKDFVVHRLTGRLATEPSDASATNAFDQRTGTWSRAVLEAARLDPAIFPEIVPSTEVVGALTAEAAAATGLLEGTRVVMGGGDGPIAAVGAGIVAPEDGAYACLGTSSWISFTSEAPVLDASMRTFTFDHVVPGRYVPTATMQAAGASVSWIHEVLAPDPDGRSLAALVAEADTDDADTGGLYFLPYLLGERAPRWEPAARGAFVGIGRHHARPHLVRAVLEGVAFNLALCIDAFRESGAAIDRVDAVGGGAASDAWLQIMADAWGVPVRRRSVVEEANSLGAAVVGAVGLGLVDSFDAARGLSEVTAEFSPDPARHDAYRQRLARFDEAYAALAPWFAGGAS
ncbi:xylulokinase [Agrococcus sp. TF02-05]|uniref:xylulokinase n=1 Tax=Agrococcus sp. TF02-05 TaxID=2815211 RepID=UPI001AA15B14|nr:xylulokinase [Agrococcus sp. TF02-05]MBO1770290.1 xylulokinase [Agrococcus sp. TF02-05]